MKMRIFFLAGFLAFAGLVPMAVAGFPEGGAPALPDMRMPVRGVLEVSGRGTAPDRGNAVQREMMAVEAARAMAYKNLAEALHGVRVHARTTVSDMMGVHQHVRTAVDGLVAGAVPVSEKVVWISDGREGPAVSTPWAEVCLRLCVSTETPECADASRTVYGRLDLARLLPVPRRTFGSSDARRYVVDSRLADYTGLVLDLSGFSFLPVLSPEIVTPDGKAVFSGRRVDPAVLASRGPVRYAQAMADARDSRFVGARPLVLRARSVNEDNQIVIDPADAAVLVRTTLEGEDFLHFGRVVLVLP